MKRAFSRRTCLRAMAAVSAAACFPQLCDSGTAIAAARNGEPIDVGDRKQLLCDDRFIAESKNVSIALNPPTKLGPVLKADRPWEDFKLTSYFTVVQDEAVIRMYYSCFSLDQWNDKDAWDKGEFLCYAESKDGLNWEKPELGLVEYQGSRKNNILTPRVVDATVFIDPVAPPEQRYKMLHTLGAHTTGLFVSCSSDGIHFTMPGAPVSPWRPDSQQNALYDPTLGKYVAYLRAKPNMGLAPNGRSVARVELDHIDQPWGNATPSIVFAADDGDPAQVDFYTNACVKYPWADSAYFMFPACYHHYPKEYGNDGLVDTSAAFSSDGVHWQRPDRRPYVPLGLPSEWDARFIMMGVGMVRVGDQILQYYNGADMSHGGTRKASKNNSPERRRWGWMGAVRQRLDGFYSADASYAGGSLTTPPLSFAGSKLVLNIDASSAGSARVAVLNKAGDPIAGYALEDCDEILGNDTARTVSWRGNTDLSKLRAQPIELMISMRSCKVHSFQFVDS